MAHGSHCRRRCARFLIRRAGEDAARRGGAYFGKRHRRAGTSDDRRVTPQNRRWLAYVLAQSRRFRPSHDDRLEAAIRLSRRRNGMAGAQGARSRPARQLRVRGHRPASRCARCPERCQARQRRRINRARRLARMQGNLHSGRRRSEACAADCRTRGEQFAMGRRVCGCA